MTGRRQADTTVWERVKAETGFWAADRWTLKAVGDFWDSETQYDDLNAGIRSYFRRLTDGWRFGIKDWPDKAYALDICSRTGNGTKFFWEKGKIRRAVLADVSEGFQQIAAKRLDDAGFKDYELCLFQDYQLPYDDATFEAVFCFESVEHAAEPHRFIQEIGRVTKPGAPMILTTPSLLWEPVHAFAAITRLSHSEGPHRFLHLNRLKAITRDAGFEIEKQLTTCLIPAGPDWLCNLGEWIEERTRNTLTHALGLRRMLFCRKIVP